MIKWLDKSLMSLGYINSNRGQEWISIYPLSITNEVALVTEALGVNLLFLVGALGRESAATKPVIAFIAHALGIMLTINMGTFCHWLTLLVPLLLGGWVAEAGGAGAEVGLLGDHEDVLDDRTLTLASELWLGVHFGNGDFVILRSLFQTWLLDALAGLEELI